jgi:phenylpropionate dioxygenase-like ring-hydroxylating dioxygenase large terminal subunit
MRALKNTWYVAAWDDEIQPGCLFRRVLLEQPILFFRDDA